MGKISVLSDLLLNIHGENDTKRIIDTFKQLDEHNFDGALLYYKNLTYDPIMLASVLMANTEHLVPLSAMQPYSMLPLTAAKQVHTLVHTYNRNMNLNMISGSIMSDFEEIGENLTKEERYERLVEYTTVLKGLFQSKGKYSFQGKYYQFHDIQANVYLEPEQRPKFYLASGYNSLLSRQAALQAADVMISIPDRIDEFREHYSNLNMELGIKVNIIARPTTEEALSYAKQLGENYTERRVLKKFVLRTMTISLTPLEREILYPRLQIDGDAPYIIGSYAQVSEYLQQYIDMGVRTIIIGNGTLQDELEHCSQLIQMLKSHIPA